MKLELLGTYEVAELLKIPKPAIAQRRQRSGDLGWKQAYPLDFPEPVAQLRCGPIWLRSEIEEYAAETERRRQMDPLERWRADRDELKRREAG